VRIRTRERSAPVRNAARARGTTMRTLSSAPSGELPGQFVKHHLIEGVAAIGRLSVSVAIRRGEISSVNVCIVVALQTLSSSPRTRGPIVADLSIGARL
jgi:hypothetical protein